MSSLNTALTKFSHNELYGNLTRMLFVTTSKLYEYYWPKQLVPLFWSVESGDQLPVFHINGKVDQSIMDEINNILFSIATDTYYNNSEIDIGILFNTLSFCSVHYSNYGVDTIRKISRVKFHPKYKVFKKILSLIDNGVTKDQVDLIKEDIIKTYKESKTLQYLLLIVQELMIIGGN